MKQEINKMIEEWVEQSYVAPHKNFPTLLKEVDYEVLGKKAKDFRKKHRIKFKEIAKALDTNVTSISLLESGKVKWKQDYLASYLENILRLSREIYSENFN